jgi:hypothetical protein
MKNIPDEVFDRRPRMAAAKGISESGFAAGTRHKLPTKSPDEPGEPYFETK